MRANGNRSDWGKPATNSIRRHLLCSHFLQTQCHGPGKWNSNKNSTFQCAFFLSSTPQPLKSQESWKRKRCCKQWRNTGQRSAFSLPDSSDNPRSTPSTRISTRMPCGAGCYGNREWRMRNGERGMRFLTYIDVEMPHRRDYAGLMFELTLTVNPK